MKLKKTMKVFLKKLSKQAEGTQEAANIIGRYFKGEPVSDKEAALVCEQFYDYIKLAGIGIPLVVIPGGSLLLPLLVTIAKKKNINLLPSAFSDETEEENENDTDEITN